MIKVINEKQPDSSKVEVQISIDTGKIKDTSKKVFNGLKSMINKAASKVVEVTSDQNTGK